MKVTAVNYWLWLQNALGVGACFKEIIEYFGSVESLYNANVIDWKMSPVLTAKQVESLCKSRLEATQTVVDECKRNGWDIVCFDAPNYPERLKAISNPPAVLFVDGIIPDFDRYAVIGIVGTRKASSYAVKAAKVMAKGISQCGALVISGGALGVDTAAHIGALEAGADTFAVLGNGLGADYLKANAELRERIRTHGALISEFPPYEKASKTTFPLRNRIISGLSVGLLVVEAGVKSGSLITAGHAAEQGRDIYAIPASIFDYNFYGTNKLIDDGAAVATSPLVLVERYENEFDTLDLTKMKTVRELTERRADANAQPLPQISFDEMPKNRRESVARMEKAAELSGDEKAVYNALSEDFQSSDAIIEKTGLSPQKVLVAFTTLEIKGLAESTTGKRFRLKG